MHIPPVVRGNLVVRGGVLLVGLALCALGIVLMIEARLGLPPWDVLQQGISKRTPLSFGMANVAVALVLVVVAWRLGARIGLGTVANAALIGVFIDRLTSIGAIDRLSDGELATRVPLFILALVAFGLGTGLYIGADLGAGPRDSLMLVLARRTGRRIALVRGAIETVVAVAGFALGGALGIGTAVFALAIGPVVELGFGALVLTGISREAPPKVQAATIDAR